jgi:hypothetical protein
LQAPVLAWHGLAWPNDARLDTRKNTKVQPVLKSERRRCAAKQKARIFRRPLLTKKD